MDRVALPSILMVSLRLLPAQQATQATGASETSSRALAQLATQPHPRDALKRMRFRRSSLWSFPHSVRSLTSKQLHLKSSRLQLS
jgi:hypothetical protein